MINIPSIWHSESLQNKKIRLLLAILPAFFLLDAEKFGFIRNPVADLLMRPIHSRSIKDEYKKLIEVSPEKGQYSCPRVHQAIFNERVRIIQELDDEVQIGIFNCFYETAFSLEKQHYYWTHKDNIVTEEELVKLDATTDAIFPIPISFEQDQPQDDDVITLILPWCDMENGVVYSVGTRFKHFQANDTPGSLGIIFYGAYNRTVRISVIDQNLCVMNHFKLSLGARQKLFVEILHLWAHHSTRDESISYVWGGLSWAHSSAKNFFLIDEKRLDQPVSYWVRPDLLPPCSGFDCSGLILRAAQIAGLPYYFKNTTTILHNLRPLVDGEALEEGDIIWCPGHVMVVTDLENNLFVEARGYCAGVGRVLEASLSERFVEVSTYDEFVQKCQQHCRLHIKGQKKGRQYKLLKLSSLWRD